MINIVKSHAIVAMTDTRGIISDVNDKFCEISGYDRDELIGQSHAIINSGHHSRAFWNDLWQTICRGETWHGEICNRKKNGGLYWVESTIGPILDSNSRIEGYIAVRTDVTRQKLSSILIEAERLALMEISRGAALSRHVM
ncbi:PAS domain-containing protein [Luteithermobacter gelatinilyticus]|uniref:PAS domain-containing protein n=1 Tax=Luteithermobacter gelatinilyticus TaxID=2582913 RepID=UPI003CCC7B16